MKSFICTIALCMMGSVSALLEAQISWVANPSSACAPSTVTFTNTSTDPNAVTWYWYLGDGNNSSAFEPIYTYTQPGNYWVTLQAYDAIGQYLGYYSGYVYVIGAQPFNMNFDTICPGDELQVWSNGNSGSYYEWDFGDGFTDANTYGSSNHSYSAPGTYNVMMIETNSCGVDTIIQPVVVMNNLPVLNPSFSLAPSVACPTDEVDFWTNWDYTYMFDYGDGTAPTTDWYHNFDSVGVYQVSVTLMNGCGNSLTLYDTVTIQSNLPFGNNAYLSFWPDSVCPGETFSFSASSAYNTFYWDFGDGNNSTEMYPDHGYTSAGNYPVFVTITNGCGSDTTIYDTVVVGSNIPVSSLSFSSPDTVCPGDSIIFNAYSSVDESTLQWDFGDGGQALGDGLYYAYTNTGVYNVSVTATNGCGLDSVYSAPVVVSNNAPVDTNDFMINIFPSSACPGDTVLFLLMPTGGNFYWDFGDGDTSASYYLFSPQPGITFSITEHVYTGTGLHQVIFHFTNACGNSAQRTMYIEIGGNIPASGVSFMYDQTVPICEGLPVNFLGVGGVNYTWDFGDGSGLVYSTGSLDPVPHSYQNSGLYTVTVTGYNSCGNSDSWNDDIYIPETTINLVTNTTSANCGVDNGSAIVSVSGGDTPYHYEWSSGDTTVVADSLPSGIYTVTVTDDNQCQNFDVATISDQEAPTILISNILDVSCANGNNGAIDINLIGSSAPYIFSWSNGAATEDLNQLGAGPYEVSVTDANGCVATESMVISEPPAVNIGFTTTTASCGGNDGTATVTVNGTTSPYQFFWSNGQGSQTATGLSAGIYNVTVVDANSCSVTGSVALSNSGAPLIIVDSISSVGCGGSNSGIYINPIAGTTPYSFLWSNGSTSEDLSGVAPGTYTLTLTDGAGCKSTLTETITYESPKAQSICVVTVDSVTSANKIVWTKPSSTGIDAFRIYRESTQSGVYYLAGEQAYDSLSEFVDTVADPALRSWRYKLAVVDSCGNESNWSNEHKTIHVNINQGLGNTYNLIWDNYEGFSYNTFYVWRYTNVNGWELLDSVPANLTSYTDINPPTSWLLYYVVEVHSPNSCVATRSQSYNSSRSNRANVNGNVLVDDWTNGAGIRLYPNPTNDHLLLEWYGSTKGYLNLYIHDMKGSLVKSLTTDADAHSATIDTYNLPAGVYNVSIMTASFVGHYKIIVNH